jgi:membrane-bound serine protease (ClpP class)
MLAIDPNVIYLALLIALWLGVTAAYIPGTGLIEGVAVVAMIAVVFTLRDMPTQWSAVVILVLGALMFIVLPFLKQRFVLLAVGGLILQTIGGLFMFGLGQVSPLIVGLTVLLSLLYYRYALIPILQKMRELPLVDDDSNLIGETGRVVTALNPTGTVYVGGEMWSATSDKSLKPGTEVVVIDRQGLNVVVEGVKRKRTPQASAEE